MRASRLLSTLSLLVVFSACAGANAPSLAPPQTSTPVEREKPAAEKPGILAGRVLGPDGKPVAGAFVALVPAAGENAAATTRSGDDGRFRVDGIATGRYGITVTSPGLTAGYLDVFQLEKDATIEGITVQLGGKGRVVQGIVRDADGKPPRDALVVAQRISNFEADLFFAPPAEDGSFHLILPEAEYSIHVLAPERESDAMRLKVSDKPLEFRLERAPSLDKPAPNEVVDWIRTHAIPLDGPEAGKGLDDIRPIKKIVGKARVVSLGEATHGTREFFQLKHRVLELLATEMDFTVFGIEASFPDSLALNEYVLTGKGDPAAALSEMRFWVWDTEEVLGLVRWMRKYNEDPAHTKKLRFFGFDMQTPARSVRALVDWLRVVDRGLAAKAASTLEPLSDDFKAEHYGWEPDPVRAATAAGIQEIAQKLDGNRATYEKKSSPTDWKMARLHASVVQQAAAMLDVRGRQFGIRDKAMAENVRALLDMEPGTKMVLWSHNGHAQRGSYGRGTKSMGSHLHDALGDDQVILGFAFNRGSFQARRDDIATGMPIAEHTVQSLPPGSLDATLGRVGAPLFALDMRPAPEGSPARMWFDARLSSRSIGSAFSQDWPHTVKQSPRRSFDALLFVDRTSAARPTEGGRRPPHPNRPPASAPENLDFEQGEPGKAPPGWTTPPPLHFGGYEASSSRARAKSGKQCALLSRTKPWPWGYGRMVQDLDASAYRGKRLRIKAWARAESLGPGAYAQLFAETRTSDSTFMPTGPFVHLPHPAIASKQWREFTIEMDVPPGAKTLTVGFALIGEGKAYLDDLRIEITDEAAKGASLPNR